MGCASSKADPWSLASEGCLTALAQWIDSGGGVDAIDPVKGRGSLLHAAARSDQVECIKLLLKCGANVSLETPQHGTPLHAAAAAGAGNAVTLLLANGASTTVRLKGLTPAELAQQEGYPATAGLIRMTQDTPAESQAGAAPQALDSSATDRSGAVSAQRAASLAAQRAAAQAAAATQTQLRLREIHKQLSAVDPELQPPGMSAPRRAASDPSVLLPLGYNQNHLHHPPAAQRSVAPPSATSRQARHPSAGSVLMGPQVSVRHQQHQQHQQPTDAELEALLERMQQLPNLQHGRGTPPGSGHSERSARAASLPLPREAQSPAPVRYSGGSSASAGAAISRAATPPLAAYAPVPPEAISRGMSTGASGTSGPADPGAAAAATDAGAAPASLTANGAAAPLHGMVDAKRAPSLPRIASYESLKETLAEEEEEVEEDGGLPRSLSLDDSKGSDSRDSSAGNSLLNDPLLDFVRKAMLSKQPPGPAASSPFASAATQVPAQGQQQQQGTPPPAGTTAAAGRQGSEQLQDTPSQRLPSHRPTSTDLLGNRGSTPNATRSSGSLSLSVDIRPWEIEFEDLALQKTIGEGSFGKVYVAKWHETLVAVKVLLDLEEAQKAAGPEAAWTLSNPILFNLQKECGLMASLRHPNVVQFMGVSAMPPAMITEYCAKGSLADVLKSASVSRQKAAQLTWLRRLNMALDATKGMLYLHKRGIVHRDLKSPNLLVESTWKVKVADFNLSKIVEDTGSGRSTIANMNPRWLAPEILNGEPATMASDVFSWGVVMWELLTFQLPWPHVSPWGLVGKLMDGMRLRVPSKDELPGPDTASFACLDDYISLMQRCWAQAPEDRPHFEEVIHELRKMLELQARSTG